GNGIERGHAVRTEAAGADHARLRVFPRVSEIRGAGDAAELHDALAGRNVGQHAVATTGRDALDLLPARAVELPGVDDRVAGVRVHAAGQHAHAAHVVVDHLGARAHGRLRTGDRGRDPVRAIVEPGRVGAAHLRVDGGA